MARLRRYLLALNVCALLAGCGDIDRMTPAYYDKAVEMCKAHGGLKEINKVDLFYTKRNARFVVSCKNEWLIVAHFDMRTNDEMTFDKQRDERRAR